MKVRVNYYFLQSGQCPDHVFIKVPSHYNDNKIRDKLMFELWKNGYGDYIMKQSEYVGNAFGVYDPVTFEKVLEVCWLTDFSIVDRIKNKLFPTHRAKKEKDT